MESKITEASSQENVQDEREDTTINAALLRPEEHQNRFCMFVSIDGTHTSSTETDTLNDVEAELVDVITSRSESFFAKDNNMNLVGNSEAIKMLPEISSRLAGKEDLKTSQTVIVGKAPSMLEDHGTIGSQPATDSLGKVNDNIPTPLDRHDDFNNTLRAGQPCMERKPNENGDNISDKYQKDADSKVAKSVFDAFGRSSLLHPSQPGASVIGKVKVVFATEENVQFSGRERGPSDINASQYQQNSSCCTGESSTVDSNPCRPVTGEVVCKTLKNDGPSSSGLTHAKTIAGDSEPIVLQVPVHEDFGIAVPSLAPCERTFHMLHIEAASSPTSSIMYRPPLCVRFWSVLTDFFTAVCLCLQVNRDCIFCLGFFVAFVVSASFLTAFFYRTLNVDPQIYQQHHQLQRDVIVADKVETATHKRQGYYF